VVTGWGTFKSDATFNGSSSQFLKYETVTIFDTEECNGTQANYEG